MRHRRSRPPQFSLFQGSIVSCPEEWRTAKEREHSLQNLDVLTMIEVIEHLEERDLDTMAENVFDVLAPETVVVNALC